MRLSELNLCIEDMDRIRLFCNVLGAQNVNIVNREASWFPKESEVIEDGSPKKRREEADEEIW